jgi:hypothetical protein
LALWPAGISAIGRKKFYLASVRAKGILFGICTYLIIFIFTKHW